jgi:hypothetical protein
MTTRHEVYSAFNKPMTWFGVDTRIFICAAFLGLLVLACSTSKTGMASAFGSFFLVIGAGAIACKNDSRFLALFPIQTRLKAHYEAGKR